MRDVSKERQPRENLVLAGSSARHRMSHFLHGSSLVGNGTGRRRALGRRGRPEACGKALAQGDTSRLILTRSCDDQSFGRDRGRRTDGAHARRRIGAGGRGRRRRRAPAQSGTLRRACARDLLAHHRSARPARHRGPIPLGGTNRAGHGLRRHPPGHQRLPDPPQLRARAAAEAHRAHPRRLGHRARGANPLRPRNHGIRAARRRCRRRTRRRSVTARAISRRVRRWTQPHTQDRGHRLPGLGSDDEQHPRGSGDDGEAAVRGASFGRRHVCLRQGGVRDQRRRNHIQGCRPHWRHGHRAERAMQPPSRRCTISRSCSSPRAAPTTASTAQPGSPGSRT